MSEPSTTSALTGTAVAWRWIERARVDEFVHASDGYQTLLAWTLAVAGVAAGGGIALVVGVVHPGTLYLVLCVLVGAAIALGIMTWREHRHLAQLRGRLDAATAVLPQTLHLGSPPATPTFTVGSQGAASQVSESAAQTTGTTAGVLQDPPAMAGSEPDT